MTREVYIAADDSRAAERWIARIIAQAEVAARMPMAGRIVPERFEGHRLMPRDVAKEKE